MGISSEYGAFGACEEKSNTIEATKREELNDTATIFRGVIQIILNNDKAWDGSYWNKQQELDINIAGIGIAMQGDKLTISKYLRGIDKRASHTISLGDPNSLERAAQALDKIFKVEDDLNDVIEKYSDEIDEI